MPYIPLLDLKTDVKYMTVLTGMVPESPCQVEEERKGAG
jgi:hypothetical protein